MGTRVIRVTRKIVRAMMIKGKKRSMRPINPGEPKVRMNPHNNSNPNHNPNKLSLR